MQKEKSENPHQKKNKYNRRTTLSDVNERMRIVNMHTDRAQRRKQSEEFRAASNLSAL